MREFGVWMIGGLYLLLLLGVLITVCISDRKLG